MDITMIGCVYKSPIRADLVLMNGKIWTIDKSQPQAEAVAVWKGRILAIVFLQENLISKLHK